MPTTSGLMRRRGAASDADVNRRSTFLGDSLTNSPVPDAGRVSEQLPRKPTPEDFIGKPVHQQESSSNEQPDEPIEARPATPSVQEQNPKHRRFSMLRFRHASDPQLSAKARLQAQAEPTPRMPQG